MTRLLSLIILVTMTAQMAFAKISFSTELLNSANQGNVEAQYDLALCYYYGYGCNADYESALNGLMVLPKKAIIQQYMHCRFATRKDMGAFVIRNLLFRCANWRRKKE